MSRGRLRREALQSANGRDPGRGRPGLDRRGRPRRDWV